MLMQIDGLDYTLNCVQEDTIVNITVVIENYRYEVFAGGEDGGKTKVLSNDLFWGMKHQFKGYFTAIQEAHTGNVNDYSLWIVITLAVVILFAVIFI